jgi:uncharacterized membrane protein
MLNLPEMKKGTTILIGVVAAVSVIGTLVILGSGSVGVGDILGALEDTSPRVMGFLALPFVIVVVVVAGYWLSKREERMWKNALMKTRAAREQEAAKKESLSD